MSKRKIHQKTKYCYDYTLDLHGYNLEDAIYKVESILYSGNYRLVLIVHGLGQGILKNGIRKYLNANDYIKKCYYGEDLNIMGREGVTLVEV
jgi:dsDNA-specific endonuclease/ATPase MutS2